MTKKRKLRCEAAFNRLELAVVVATVAMLAGLVLPTLGSTKTRSQRVTCVGNLRQLGHALHVWGNDHGDKTPWRTPTSDGGTFLTQNPLKNTAWYQLAWLSNELVTPRILVCPADKNVGVNRVVAWNWSSMDPAAGYATLGFRDRATSYTVALDAYFDQPRSILSGDRNLRTAGINSSCSSQVGSANFFTLGPFSPRPEWTNSIHFQGGNVLFYSGEVEQLSVPALGTALNLPYPGDDNGVLHFLIPN